MIASLRAWRIAFLVSVATFALFVWQGIPAVFLGMAGLFWTAGLGLLYRPVVQSLEQSLDRVSWTLVGVGGLVFLYGFALLVGFIRCFMGWDTCFN